MATLVYMTSVGIAELRQNLSSYLRRVENGERLVVTDRNRAVAELSPVSGGERRLDRLVATGRVAAPRHRRLPGPLATDGDPRALSRALDAVRDER